jgi:outer membrane lipoprotein SlyB
MFRRIVGVSTGLQTEFFSSRRQAETNDSRKLGALSGAVLGGFGGSLAMYICATAAVYLPAA